MRILKSGNFDTFIFSPPEYIRILVHYGLNALMTIAHTQIRRSQEKTRVTIYIINKIYIIITIKLFYLLFFFLYHLSGNNYNNVLACFFGHYRLLLMVVDRVVWCIALCELLVYFCCCC